MKYYGIHPYIAAAMEEMDAIDYKHMLRLEEILKQLEDDNACKVRSTNEV